MKVERIPWYVVTREHQTFEGGTIQEFVTLLRDRFGFLGRDLGRGVITRIEALDHANPEAPRDERVLMTQADDGCVYALRPMFEYSGDGG